MLKSRSTISYYTFLNSILILLFSVISLVSCSGDVKEPAVSGSFYPADKDELLKMVDNFMSDAEGKLVDGRLIALLAPHAGYQYSGAVAAYSYSRLKERNVRTVILIGPSHYKTFTGASVYERGNMRTPLGRIKIDGRIARSLIDKNADVVYYPEAFEKEHSLEVQLPFIQRISPKIKVVPILIGTPSKKSFEFLTEKLAEIMRNDKGIILIASTDFSHYHDYDNAVKMDRLMVDAVERMSIEDVQRYLVSGKAEICGGYPVLFTMAVARKIGVTNGVLYKYANSGDVTGNRERVVGYASIGLYITPLGLSEKMRLVELAKESVLSYVKEKKTPEVRSIDKRLLANGATFVTINKNGTLRGCMGNITPYIPLYRSVISNAINACSRDPRFPPMKEEELKDIQIEVTILSPLESLKDKKAIEIGKHGLYIVKDRRSGILLPQVPVEFGWDRITFLEQVSKKAGLQPDAWKNADLYRFTAEVLRERS